MALVRGYLESWKFPLIEADHDSLDTYVAPKGGVSEKAPLVRKMSLGILSVTNPN